MIDDKLELTGILNRQTKDIKSIVLVSHLNPDGDAVGSALALFHYLSEPGISCNVIMPNDYPDYLKWLPGNDSVLIFNKNIDAGSKIINDADIIFLLDFNTPDRAGKAREHIFRSGASKIMIDHHPKPSDFADFIFSDTLSSSTAELVFRFIELRGCPEMIDKNVATCLYAGIMADTGSFSYNSSQPETYRVLSELLGRGIDKDYIYSMVYDNFSENRMKLLGYCLDKKMVVLKKFRTAYISLSLDEKKKYGYIRGDSEGFVNYPLSIRNVELAVFFIENDDHVKISFRSKGKVDTNYLAAEFFDGGGHINASGGESKLNLSDTINKFVSLLPEYISKKN